MQTSLFSNNIRVRHVSDGTTDTFSCTIELIDESYLQVYFGETLQTTGWTYDESFQQVVFDEIPAEGTIITFLRYFPTIYTKSITEKGIINPEVLDNQMVEMVARIQTVEEKLSRTPTYPIDTEKSSEEVYDDFKRIESVATSAANSVLETLEEIEEVRNEAVTSMSGAADAAKTTVSKYVDQTLIPMIKGEGQESIDIARTWATGEQAEVEAVEAGQLSSRGFADLSLAFANAPEDVPVDESGMIAMEVFRGPKGDKGEDGKDGIDGKDGKDGIDGKDGKDGIDGKDGKDGANGKSFTDGYVTDCITEIPQDIKLELVDGTMPLKAGSKVYEPNGKNADGSLRFDEVTISSDMTLARNSSAKYFSFLKNNGATSDTMPVDYCYSGSTTPTITHTYAMWYDTTNNKVKWTNDNGSTWTEGYSLPIAIISNDTPGTQNASNIDQVFNGFSRIGSTGFLLPGVKGLMPNGKNTDDTLKNIEFTVDKVITATSTTPMNFYFAITPYSLTSGGGYMVSTLSYTTSETPPSTARWFKPSENMYYIKKDDVWNPDIQTHVGFGVNTANAITSFQPKLPFRAVDYNDKATVVDWGMPDFDAGVSIELNVDIVAPYPCFVTAEAKANTSQLAAITLSAKDINDVYQPVGVSYSIVSGYSSSAVVSGYFAKGQTFKCSKTSGSSYSAIIYPLKGVN